MSFLMCSVYRFVARFLHVHRMRIARFAPWGADSPIGAPIFGGFEFRVCREEILCTSTPEHLQRVSYLSGCDLSVRFVGGRACLCLAAIRTELKTRRTQGRRMEFG